MRATVERALATLKPIGLEELIEQASLLTRVDRKYIVPRSSLGAVLADLDPHTRVLEIDGARGSAYESVYFDTPDLASYLAAARRRRRRFKIRTRAYLDSGEAYLEVKTRGGRSLTVKDRLEYDLDDRDVLTSDGRRHVDLVLTETGVGDLGARPLAPTLTTSYVRTTLFLPGSTARATIDVDLCWALDADRRLTTPDLAIVETKSGSSPSPVDRVLWAHGHRPDGISKYGVGLAALRPELPSNKWSRILRRHFVDATRSPRADRPATRAA
jgi:hypothetical protein